MKRRPMLFKRLAQSKGEKGLVISCVGVSNGVGVTHSAIMLGSYLAKLGNKVALVELNGKKDFEKIERAYEGNGFDSTSTNDFKIKRCHFYKEVSSSKLIEIFAETFDYYILDIGSNNACFEEFLRGDIRFVVGLLSEWKKDEVIDFYRNHKMTAGQKQWCYLFPLSLKQDLADIRQEIGNKSYRLPFNPDPFLIKPESQKVLHQLLL